MTKRVWVASWSQQEIEIMRGPVQTGAGAVHALGNHAMKFTFYRHLVQCFPHQKGEFYFGHPVLGGVA